MSALFVDSSVLLLAVGGDHPSREPCRQVVAAASQGRHTLHASVEAGQEFLFHRMRRVSARAAVGETRLLRRLVVWHPFDEQVLEASIGLVAQHGLRGRDAVHAATALSAGFTGIVSTDADFEGIPSLERVDPGQMS